MEIGVRELKAKLSEILARVERGEVVGVTSRGRRIAQIVPVPGGVNIERGLAEGWITRAVDGPPTAVTRRPSKPGTPTTSGSSAPTATRDPLRRQQRPGEAIRRGGRCSYGESVTYDIDDPQTWPDATIVVRGGVNTLEELRDALQTSGGISVVSRPEVPFEKLAASVRNNQVRRTTVKAVLDAGGRLVPTYGDDEPPNHCDLFGLTAEKLDSILSTSEPNPVPKDERWRGAPR